MISYWVVWVVPGVRTAKHKIKYIQPIYSQKVGNYVKFNVKSNQQFRLTHIQFNCLTKSLIPAHVIHCYIHLHPLPYHPQDSCIHIKMS